MSSLYNSDQRSEDGFPEAAAVVQVKRKGELQLVVGGRDVHCNVGAAVFMVVGIVSSFAVGLVLGGGGGGTTTNINAAHGAASAHQDHVQPEGPQTPPGTATQVTRGQQQQIDAGEAGYLASSNASARTPWAPLPAATTQLNRVAFGSCANQAFPQPFWDTLSFLESQLYVMGGDNVYGDCLGKYSATPDVDCDELLAAYEALDGHPSFAGIKPRLPIVAAWDDHDAGMNDRGADFAYQNDAKRYFMDFFQLAADDPRRSREGLYHSYRFGPSADRQIQIILLDCRSFRSSLIPTDEPNFYTRGKELYVPDYRNRSKTMLGEAQWAWLRETLLEPARLRIVMSSIQLVAAGHGWERWGLLPFEAQRFYSLIASTRAKGVVVLSGDRHVGGIYKMENQHKSTTNGVVDGPYNLAYPVYEVTSSALTHTYAGKESAQCVMGADGVFPSWKDGCDEPGPNRIGPLVHLNNIGLIDIDWDRGNLTIALRKAERTPKAGFNNDAGRVLASLSLNLDELQGADW